MVTNKPNDFLDTATQVRARRLLIIGPKPPPIGGSPLTVQAILNELKNYPSIEVDIINTSPGIDVREKMTGFNFEKIKRSVSILPQFLKKISSVDSIVVFSNDLFSITLAPLLLFISHLFHKPFFLKPVGAGLDLYIKAQKKLAREYLLFVLRSTNGILAQTRLLKEDLEKLGCKNVFYLPGCRPFQPSQPDQKNDSDLLKLIYLGHITRRKGILYLLDALRMVHETHSLRVTCDFYGPIHHELHNEFMQKLAEIPDAHYCGEAEPGTGTQLISNYDALVLPTYYDTEGHPGVLIEAMYAGVPAITTQIRTLYELITDKENGLLVPTQDSSSLAEAILFLTQHPEEKRKMGQANFLRGQEFRADAVVKQLLQIVMPNRA